MSDRSATAPAQADSSRIGPNWKPARMPTLNPLPVSLSTSRVRATLVSQLPVLEISCPMKNSRKLRFRRARNVFLMPAYGRDSATSLAMRVTPSIRSSSPRA